MDPESREERSGCARCWPESADAAWRARGGLDRDAPLIDESHHIVAILRCTGCGQAFVSAFCETIDWVDGDDPQSWTLMPITPDEAATLRQADEANLETALGALAPERRSLQRDYPKDASAPTVFWTTGIPFRPHD